MAAGDQLRVYRGGYWHHGIDVGDGTIVHFGKAGLRAAVQRTGWDEFLLGSSVLERLPVRLCPVPAEEVVRRALECVGKHAYNLALNNCESIACFCQGIEPDSPQVQAFLRRAKLDVSERGPWRGGFDITARVAGRAVSLTAGFLGRYDVAQGIERLTDRHAVREWLTDRHELRWEPYPVPQSATADLTSGR